ncbi:uncharacterized protein DUF1516 [Aneurinibacillus soli]|uniref:Uncharacterized protein n=1 Tax=Aneurinibacillus soli TaxID=1500254 RepID=A0A0U4WGU5_9BACL|nr:DUF1516 family protein [Aneurinibacillus soli]PYE58180.1 uncharacterized protein DUF1516 [Aneurinibacillus soli]BAU27896.1 hypothetical protein CB4_02070 [Aneurinibacillus soli]
MIHIHTGLWALLLVLFVLSFVMLRIGNERGYNILHMLARLIMLLVVASGFMLVSAYNFIPITLLKGALAIVLIGIMEMILIRTHKGERNATLWVLFIIDLLAVMYIGYVKIG